LIFHDQYLTDCEASNYAVFPVLRVKDPKFQALFQRSPQRTDVKNPCHGGRTAPSCTNTN